MVAGLKALLADGTVVGIGKDGLKVERSLPHGHVAAAHGAVRKIALDRLMLGPPGAEIGIEVGAVLDKHKMAKHFKVTIGDASLIPTATSLDLRRLVGRNRGRAANAASQGGRRSAARRLRAP